MTLSDLSIRRPVFAWMLMAALIVFGAICYLRLGVSQMPDVDFPVVNVAVTWQGAAPEVMESEVVDRVEEAVISVEGVKDITSSIRQGSATVTLEFDINRNVDAALQEVQSAVGHIKFPIDVDPPVINKTNPDDQPIIWLGVSSSRPLRELIEYIDLELKDQFQTVPGVGEITLGGFSDRNLRIWVDPQKLKDHELTVLDLQKALEIGHLEEAAGFMENSKTEYNLRVMGEGITPEQVANILITQRGGKPIYNSNLHVGDVARVEDGLNDIRRISRINGVPGVGLGIKKQRGANAVEVGDNVKKKLAELQALIPKDIQIGVNFDSTIFVRQSIEETEFSLLLAALATGFVCWFFLGSLRPTFNILLSIPTSIIGSFAVIYFMGFTLNMFTILGLALAIGIVVDDAIMVLENIYRHRDMGKDRVNASLEGGREITFAAAAATIAVVAIFLPIAFMRGIIGRFFFQFGITISAAVTLSLLEAITLIPMRCSEFMESRESSGRFARFMDRAFERLAGLYRGALRLALNWRISIIAVSLVLFGGSLYLNNFLRKEFIPPQDQGVFLLRLQAPVGSSLDYTSAKFAEAENYIKGRPEVERYFAAIGGISGGEVNSGIIFLTLKELQQRKLSQAVLMDQFRKDLNKIADLKVVTQDLSLRGFTAQRGYPIEFNIRGSEWEVLKQKAEEIVKRFGETGLGTDLDTDYRTGQPELQVWPLRQEAADRGISVEDISNTISAAIGGIRVGKFTKGSRRYDVRIRIDQQDRVNPDDIDKLQVRNTFGEIVPIKDVIQVKQVPTLQTITRRNRERSISVFANVAAGKSQADGLAAAQRIAKEVLPEGYRLYLGSGASTFVDSFNSLTGLIWLGIIVAYMVLASQFNSFLHPITVLVALPFSISGAFVALYLTNQSLNLYSMIGIVLLMGIVKKNSIILVDFTNHKRFVEGLPLKEALLAACPIRLRPILMTSCATIAAAVPPALALGPGAESRIPMSVTVIGGVLLSTLFTLFVVPCVYSLFARLERRKAHHLTPEMAQVLDAHQPVKLASISDLKRAN